MVQVGVMRVAVHHGGVAMPVGVPGVRHFALGMRMLMMVIVHMAVLMLGQLVHVFMAMPFRQVQIEADGHQRRGGDQRPGHRLTEQGDSEKSADERCRREVCAGSRGSELAEGGDEQNEADAVA